MRITRLQPLPARATGESLGRVLAFPQKPEIRRHLDALQVIALVRPQAVKAILELTQTVAESVTREKVGGLVVTSLCSFL